MTPETAANLLRRMLHPRLGEDPDGIDIRVRGRLLEIHASSLNMRRVIGTQGNMIKALRLLFEPLNYQVNTAQFGSNSALSAIPCGPLSVPALTMEYLTHLCGDRWSQVGDDARAAWRVPPDVHTPSLANALNTWAYLCGRDNDLTIKYFLEPELQSHHATNPTPAAAA